MQLQIPPFEVKDTTIGLYLLDRLHQLGVNHIFGIPGDYIIRFNKLNEEHPIAFVNATRENTAGYLADAYARINGIGVACITYGVGINIVNAVAQAYVESSPLIIISGSAGTDEFAKHPTRHHLINKTVSENMDRTQLEIFKQITIDQAVLKNPETAAREIDRVLDHCLHYKKPVYIELPRDMVDQQIPPHICQATPFPPSDPHALKEAVQEIVHILEKANRPIIWAGHELIRYNLQEQLLSFAEKFQIPIASTLLGKSVISESHPLSIGVYQGGMSRVEVAKFVDRCDAGIAFGVIQSDVDTGMFTENLGHDKRVFANAFNVSIGNHRYDDTSLIDLMEKLSEITLKKTFKLPTLPKNRIEQNFTATPNKKITSARVFECLQKHLTTDNILVTDIGDCLFGSSDLILDQDCFISNSYFATLGFGTPAAVGAQLASPDKRVIGLIGDGAFQMTCTELSTAARYQLDPIIIVLNNHGYGTERPLIEGKFNDILNWNYYVLPKVLGAGRGYRATTEEELDQALTKALSTRGEFTLIEVELGKTDFSPAMHRFSKLVSKHIK